MDPQSTGLLMLTSLLLSATTLIAVLRETHGTLTLGRVIKRVRPGRHRRWLAVLGMALIIGGIAIGPTEVPSAFAFSELRFQSPNFRLRRVRRHAHTMTLDALSSSALCGTSSPSSWPQLIGVEAAKQ